MPLRPSELAGRPLLHDAQIDPQRWQQNAPVLPPTHGFVDAPEALSGTDLLAPRAIREAERCAHWWREHRPAAPMPFEEELRAALDRRRASAATRPPRTRNDTVGSTATELVAAVSSTVVTCGVLGVPALLLEEVNSPARGVPPAAA